MLLLFLTFLALIIPIVGALLNGSTYTFAFSIFLAGIVLYFINVFLSRQITKSRLAAARQNSSGYITAGTGIIPYWVKALAGVGIGFVPSGLIIALLLWLGMITNKAL